MMFWIYATSMLLLSSCRAFTKVSLLGELQRTSLFSRPPKIPNDRHHPAASRDPILALIDTEDLESRGIRRFNQESRRMFGARLKKFLPILAAASITNALVPLPPATAQDDDEPTTERAKLPTKLLLKGIVTLPNDDAVLSEAATTASALYVTVRPSQADNIPRAILDGSNGKPPPVLAARIPNPSAFPLEFTLSAPRDLTVEGSAVVGTNENSNKNNYWFEGLDWIISARWDTDGVAATRDPSDLVGRTVQTAISRRADDSMIRLELQGRGFTGKLVTGKKK